jgi:antitoxin (DNA-binding transcriptional repressor) of toxin-antitoxin stability system
MIDIWRVDMNVSLEQSFTTISIGTDDMRKRMGEILDCVNLRGDEFLIERKHHPLAVLIPVQKHKIITQAARKFLLNMLQNKENNLSQEEADSLADFAKHETRNKKK